MRPRRRIARAANAVAIAISFAIALAGTLYQREFGKDPIAANSSLAGLIFYLLFQVFMNFLQVFFDEDAAFAIARQGEEIARLRDRLDDLGDPPSGLGRE